MAVSRIKTWVSAEVLYAVDLNAEIDNILNNGLFLRFIGKKEMGNDLPDVCVDHSHILLISEY